MEPQEQVKLIRTLFLFRIVMSRNILQGATTRELVRSLQAKTKSI